MLSKVLTGRQTHGATTAVFPSHGAARHESSDASGSQVDVGGLSVLRDKIRSLESQAPVDKRDAFEAGVQQGERSARAELQPVLDRMNASIQDITGLRSEMRRRAEKDTVQLALLIARRVLHRDLSMDENALSAIARVAFERLTRSESYTVTVHPRFAPAVTAALPGSQASRVRIEPDPDCAQGTLIIRSAEGVIDASVDSQLAEIEQGLTDRLA
jgi:flagellar assembly protein FliH